MFIIEGITAAELDSALFTRYKIHTVGIVWENISFLCLTPHVYTKIADMGKLVMALTEIVASEK